MTSSRQIADPGLVLQVLRDDSFLRHPSATIRAANHLLPTSEAAVTSRL